MSKHYQSLLSLFAFPVLISVFLIASGCSKGYQGKERLYPVSITVTNNGVPLTDASVVLLRESGAKTINAGGCTDQNGVAQIKIDAQWNGVPIGKYKVMLNKDVPLQSDLSEEEYRKLELLEKEAYDKKMYEKRMSMPLPVPHILSGMESPLSIDVTSSGNNTATFDIGKF